MVSFCTRCSVIFCTNISLHMLLLGKTGRDQWREQSDFLHVKVVEIEDPLHQICL